MKLFKKRDYAGSIRKVCSDDKKICFGIVGTVHDLLDEEILEYADHPPETWVFIPAPDTRQKLEFGKTREAVLKKLT